MPVLNQEILINPELSHPCCKEYSLYKPQNENLNIFEYFLV